MSSLGGYCRPRNRFFNWSTVASVSSTDSVVCESHTTFSGSRTCTLATSSGPSTSWMWAGASPAVPSTSSWPSWPISRMSKSVEANRFASWCTLVTSGQVASIVFSCRAAASACTTGATPCAEKITVSPSGTSTVSSTKIAPRFCSVCTTYLLCTISLRTYTGGPYRSSAFSTATTARSTPAQYPRGAASSTRLVFTAVVVRVSSAWPVTPPWYGAELTPPDPHHRRSTTGSGGTRVGGQPPGRFHPTSLSLPSRHRQRGNAWRSEPQVLPQRTGLREQHHQDPASQTQAPPEGRSARASTAAWTGRRCAGALNKVLPVISPQMVFQPPASDQTRRTGQAEG